MFKIISFQENGKLLVKNQATGEISHLGIVVDPSGLLRGSFNPSEDMPQAEIKLFDKEAA